MARDIKIFHRLRQQTTKENEEKKQQEYEEITTRLNSSNRPQHKPEKTQSKLLKFHTN